MCNDNTYINNLFCIGGIFMFIYIEGMDLSGKTTLANNLRSSLSGEWSIQSNALTNDNQVWLLADQARKNQSLDEDIIGYLYSIAMMVDVRNFNLTNYSNLIQDSTIAIRSLAYHSILGTSTVLEQLKDSVNKIPTPDLTIYLLADIKTRAARLRQREVDNPEEIAQDDLMVIKDPERFSKMEEKLFMFTNEYFSPMIIDTSHMTKSDVCALVLDEIRRIM